MAKKKAAKKAAPKKKTTTKKTTKTTHVTTIEGNPISAEIRTSKTKAGDPVFRVLLRGSREELPPTGMRFAGQFTTRALAEEAARDRIKQLEGGGTMPPKKKDGTPSRPARPGKPSLAMRIDSRAEIEFVPEDLLAMSLSMLLAMRLTTAGMGEEEGEFVALITDWFSSEQARRAGLSGLDQSRKDLTDEIQFYREAFKAIPIAARKIGFTVEEWSRFWFSITGEPEVAFGAIEVLGLDAPIPPVVGEITSRFSPDHPALDIAVVEGTPVRAPEDMVIAKVDRAGTGALGLFVTAWSRTAELGAFPDVGTKGAITPEEGVRKHVFGHLSAINVAPGDKLERGATFAHSGNTGVSTGPHLHWKMRVYVVKGNLFGRLIDEITGFPITGAIALTPMDPASFVPADVIEGGGAPRAPGIAWNMVNPDKPDETIGGPSYDVKIGRGDVIFNGSKSVRTKRSEVVVDPDIKVDLGIGILPRVEDPRRLRAPGGLEAERLLRRPGLLGLGAEGPAPSPFERADPTPRVVSGIASPEEAEAALTRGAAREQVALAGVTGAGTGAVVGAAGGPIGAVVGGVVGAGLGVAGGLLGLPKRPSGGRPRRRAQR